MTYSDSVWIGSGWIGRVCADPECTVILHETQEAHPTEEGAGLAAFIQWTEIVNEASVGEAA